MGLELNDSLFSKLYRFIRLLCLQISLFLYQGGWEKDETIEVAARRETIEEAGVCGDIEVSF